MPKREIGDSGGASSVSPEEIFTSLNLSDCRASDLRKVAQLLQRLANALDEKPDTKDQEHDPDHLLTEHSGRELARVAERLYYFRERRSKFLPDLLLGEPAWDILLDLFHHEAIGRKVATTDALIAARVPATTALRYLGQLEREGLIRRERARGDQRKRVVVLTSKGTFAMSEYIRSLLKYERQERKSASPKFLLRN
ncbi:hypothetical protein ACXYL9_12745 [Qipengyuania sp. CAU 1752]